MLISSPPQHLPAWQQLAAMAQQGVPHLRHLLAQPRSHLALTTTQPTGIGLDFSRQAVTPDVIAKLCQLAEQAQVAEQRQAMFAGEPINGTEQRPVLHVALRGHANASNPWGQTIDQQVHTELARVCQFAADVRAGAVRGATGLPFTHVVNIGIGGSDLGPRMATDALTHLAHPSAGTPSVTVHYVSNPDAWALHRVLRLLDPHRTLVVVSSKTFTRQETLTNAASARQWLADAGIVGDAQAQHLVAITASPKRTLAAGYLPERTFYFWDWVGGRYSVWSALGLPLALAIGPDAFKDFLAGARAMDEHFAQTPIAQNMPIVLALLGIWNRNFLKCPTHLVASYASRLARFCPFVQQLDMESNGKRTHHDGSLCQIETAPIVWGGLGVEGQHAYFQLLHQGQHRVPVDFIAVQTEATPNMPLAAEHHRVVLLNMQAQAQALALGRSPFDTLQSLLAGGLSEPQAQAMLNHRSYEGNVPSNIVWLDELTPSRLGALIALYEHKVFTQAAIWGINAFDQWGVELGKTMAQSMEQAQR
jgi:glucose-6-phosphate isomerase